MSTISSNTYEQLIPQVALEPREPLPVDPWIASSALQKAIRRGEAAVADRAILSLVRHRGSGVFRRLLVIAFEDIGIAAPDLLVAMTALCTQPSLRRSYGETAAVARWITRALVEAPKDRSTDYLISAVIHRAEWEVCREAVGRRDVAARIEMAVAAELPIAQRATATWFASGIENGDEHRIGAGDLRSLVDGFVGSGMPLATGDAVIAAVKATKEPIVLMMLPLLQELERSTSASWVTPVAVPPTRFINGVPTYALDKHTRAGRAAIGTFLRENGAVRRVLERHVPDFRHRDAARIAAFYADAVPVARRLSWDQADELEALGLDTDMQWAGVPRSGIEELMFEMRANIDHLNDVRERELKIALQVGGRA
ncbi:hypothetical protein [Aurantimonas sp. 22II-16-19i]|uniref:hypothetical protein n=1 Tax=Aurantimonas sp. 22II-16-19i TaxID=1317114 RepID=UPI0009F7DADD|nr:hypothetical protein [Aurantimonas sp. 22II-16-19i]ORE90948.1 hypothetical protein ATO4_19839 [Aurantimonas sp. 22II-16-19i]